MRTFFANLWNKIWGTACRLLPDLESRVQTDPAKITFLVIAGLAFLFLFIRLYKYSTGIRKLKEQHWNNRADRQDVRKLRRRSWGRFFLGILFLAIVGFILVYFVYPRIPSLSKFSLQKAPEDAYAAVYDALKKKRVISLIGVRVLFIAIPMVIWAFSRRFVTKGLRVFLTVMFTLSMISLIPMALLTLRTTLWEPSGTEMANQANVEYHNKHYENAEAVYARLLEDNINTAFSTESLLNNLALCQLQLGKNEEALDTMLQVFKEDFPSDYHLINLLVAGQANGYSSREVLEMAGVTDMVENSDLAAGDLNKYVRLRNAIAYNIVWMDMELGDDILGRGTRLDALFPNHDVGLDFWAGYRTPEYARTSLGQALKMMQSENEKAYDGEDTDITELQAYLEALEAGGQPVTAGEPGRNAGEKAAEGAAFGSVSGAAIGAAVGAIFGAASGAASDPFILPAATAAGTDAGTTVGTTPGVTAGPATGTTPGVTPGSAAGATPGVTAGPATGATPGTAVDSAAGLTAGSAVSSAVDYAVDSAVRTTPGSIPDITPAAAPVTTPDSIPDITPAPVPVPTPDITPAAVPVPTPAAAPGF